MIGAVAQGEQVTADTIINAKAAEPLISTDENGQMLLNERGQPIIDYGSAQNIQVEGVTLENSSWQESHTRLRTGLGNLGTCQPHLSQLFKN